MTPDNNDPLVAGGQGRSETDLRHAAEACGWAALAIVIILCVAALVGCEAEQGRVVPDQGARLLRP